jgi:hypothetical protein
LVVSTSGKIRTRTYAPYCGVTTAVTSATDGALTG